MSTTFTQALHTAARQRTPGVLLDIRQRRAVPVLVEAVAGLDLQLEPRVGREGAMLPGIGAFVRLEFQIERWSYRLSTHVRGATPLRLGLPGTLVRSERRAADRVVPAGVGAYVDFGAGPQRMTLRNLSLGGAAVELHGEPPPVGRSATVRLIADDGELHALARVRHTTREPGAVVVGLSFAPLSASACASLVGWLGSVGAFGS